MRNIALCCRPWSCHAPKVAGYEPQISCEVTRVGRRTRNSWRAVVLVDDCPMATSHHDTKYRAESWCEGMLKAYTEVHYKDRKGESQ